ncbi:MAG: hypothetical protein DRQ59_10030 [Gammaproteobacteria bacterium]|nr:MAG: hypothetical protein DRQ59_10030 [Gammaproteobacteria bacterium]
MMELLHKIWVVITTVAKILTQSRFSLIIVLLTVFSLEFVGQIKDILVGLNYPESRMQVVFFVLAVNWLAFQSWGWARYIYNRTQAVDGGKRGEPGYQRFLIDWLPRAYAIAAFVAAYRAAIHAQIDNIAYGIIAVGALVLIFLVYRRDIAEKFAAVLGKVSGNSMLYFTLAVMAVSTVYAIWSPVSFGGLLGAGAVVFLGLGSIIPAGTLLVSAARENRFPVVGFMLVLAIVFSWTNDNHRVRVIEGEKSHTDSLTLQESLDAWLTQRDPTKPMVLVATAGGGLRASYWTAVIMGRFQDQIPGFNKQVFAVSGVSGGSVGAVFYNAALANDEECVDSASEKPCFESKLLDSIGQDYLAATVTSMLYGDLIQRFLPVPVFSDRAAALEESWEAGFARIYPNADCGLENSFTSFFVADACGKQQWLPRLLINGTYEESGRRLLTTSFKVEPTTFLDTHDFYELNDQSALRASTAALNSARFSYVSPAGTFGKEINDDFVPVGHVIDGGYFENYGANTLSNLIDWLKQHSSNPPNENPFSGGLIVIAISNDSTIPLQQYDILAVPASAKPQAFLNEVLAPISGLANTRAGHGMLAYKQLAQYSEQLKSVLVGAENNAGASGDSDVAVDMMHFYLASNSEQPPPLGWILSEQSKENMRAQITEKHNCSGYLDILDRFRDREGNATAKYEQQSIGTDPCTR